MLKKIISISPNFYKKPYSQWHRQNKYRELLFPLGGVIFTLADFVCAIAANGCFGRNIVSRNVSVTFLAPAKGKVLIAEASCLREGHTTALYAADVRDEPGTYVAHATVNGYAIG